MFSHRCLFFLLNGCPNKIKYRRQGKSEGRATVHQRRLGVKRRWQFTPWLLRKITRLEKNQSTLFSNRKTMSLNPRWLKENSYDVSHWYIFSLLKGCHNKIKDGRQGRMEGRVTVHSKKVRIVLQKRLAKGQNLYGFVISLFFCEEHTNAERAIEGSWRCNNARVLMAWWASS